MAATGGQEEGHGYKEKGRVARTEAKMTSTRLLYGRGSFLRSVQLRSCLPLLDFIQQLLSAKPATRQQSGLRPCR